MGSPSRILLGDVVSLADFPGADRPREFRHSRHEDYEGETPGYPEFEFEVVEPLTWQAYRPGGPWMTRIRPRGGDGFLPAYLANVCDPHSCPRLLAKKKRQRRVECACPRQLCVHLESRTDRRTTEFYSRICGWVKEGMRADGRRFTSEQWLRRSGPSRVLVHHASPPLENDAEDGPLMLKDDTRFAGLEPQTPAEHEAAHAALNAVLGGRAPSPRPVAGVPTAVAVPEKDAAVAALIEEGLPRGRPPKRARGRGGKR